jgi:hypothetical protein
VSQAEEVEALELLVPPGRAFLSEAPELNEPGLRLVPPQPKLPQSLAKGLRESCRIVPVLNGEHDIIRVANHVEFAPQLPPHHLLSP